MVTLFDIVRQAQSGSAMDNFSRQFGLSLDQTQRAMEALLPAFTLAFQRSVQNPNSFAQLLDMMASGRYAPFFDGAGPASLAQPTGQQIIERLFGSSEASRHIAAQASAVTGIGTQVLQQMLPALAPVLMGGLFRYASIEGLADFLRGWSDWLRMLAPPRSGSRPAAETPVAAWSNLVGAMLGQGPAKPPAREPPQVADPWTSFMQGFLNGAPQGAAAPPPPPPPPPSQPNPLEALSQMFETGREVQAQYLANLQTSLEEFWRAQDGARAAPGS